MAKFVVAGKADCPFYAEAERLADTLQRSLPNFRAHKICVLPDEWEGWLDATCSKNGWKHEESPLVWRELVEQGGKGLLLGGLSDFLKHCQVMTVIFLLQQRTWRHRSNFSKRNKIISVSLNPFTHTSRILIPNLLSAEIFPKAPAVSLHLLDLDENEEELQRLREETQSLALSIFQRKFSRLIDAQANKQVKVIVSGDSHVNLRCALLVEGAHSIDSHQFVAVATQLENEARAVVAEKLGVRPTEVTEVIVWGNIIGLSYIDLQRAKVFNFQGPIKGPAFFPQPISRILPDRFASTIQLLVHQKQTNKQTKGSPLSQEMVGNRLAGSGASRDPPSPEGLFNLRDDIIFSVPVTFEGGKWSTVLDVTVGDGLMKRLELCADELWRVRTLWKKKTLENIFLLF
uniref:Malate dehydrogenase 1B, NAD (soluble) n=1 Tax=Oryzias latipes TaxID=8090 RepID=A0A3P9I1G6_ORYLA